MQLRTVPSGSRVALLACSPSLRKSDERRWFVYIARCSDGSLYTGSPSM
ncbi:MAG: hypothetical protein QM756_24570 [Polyangiaceae bacterium]